VPDEAIQTERLRLRAYTAADEAELFDVLLIPMPEGFTPKWRIAQT
jgi:hypothetical protein